MTYTRFFFLFFILIVRAGTLEAQDNIDWQKFLAKSDMVFDTLTTRWEEGIFTGNGLMGAMLYMKDENTLRLEIGRTDVRDHRKESISHLFAKARLPIGHFEIKPSGRILKNNARVNLRDAEATGTILTDKGTVQWRILTLSNEDIILFQYTLTGKEASLAVHWVPEVSISSRTKFEVKQPVNYKPNPKPISGEMTGVQYCRQPMLAGGDYTTAWKQSGSKTVKTLYITVGYNPESSSLNEAVKKIKVINNEATQSSIKRHRQWWHQYYPESFISLPDARMESFYWIQQYKLASATREGKPPIDLMGPWFRYTPWPAYWFNLNIQLTYSPLFTANRLGLSKGLIKMIDDAEENLAANVPQEYRPQGAGVSRSGSIDMISPVDVFKERDPDASDAQLEMGNLTWMLYYYWLQYRYTMDEELKNNLFPILKKNINYYIDIMHKGEDGKWHLPYTYSPEYPGGVTRDCNYDLSLFRWGCQTLLQINPQDELAEKWKDILLNLTDYPKDSTGLRIGADVGFSTSHRHYSHMLMIYPLYMMNWDQTENRELIRKSLEHWHNFPGALQGYSFTGGASMYAMMGNGEKAVNYLNQLLDRYVKPNTMYMETGPVIETPLSAATSIQELLLQSWGNTIRVFPAVPAEWKDVAFRSLRTEGALLISAVRKGGQTRWIKVKSLVGGVCTIRPGMEGEIKTTGRQKYLRKTGNEDYEVTMKKGEEIILYVNEKDLAIPLAPVNYAVGEENFWGTKNKN